MHIVIGLLGSIVTILFLLNRLAETGIDLGGLNPFLWNRRRKWKKKYEGNPIFKLTNPMDVTALLMVAVAKCDGDITKEQKAHLLGIFEKEFHLSKKDAQGLLIASVHIHGDGKEVREKVKKVIAPSLENFTVEQGNSATELVRRVAGTEEMCAQTVALVSAIEKELAPGLQTKVSWT